MAFQATQAYGPDGDVSEMKDFGRDQLRDPLLREGSEWECLPLKRTIPGPDLKASNNSESLEKTIR